MLCGGNFPPVPIVADGLECLYYKIIIEERC